MSEESFSEDEFERMLGGDDNAPEYRHFVKALWELFQAHKGTRLSDGRTVGFAVIAELEAPEGRAIRFAYGTGDGSPLPSWTIRGYLAEAMASMDAYDRQTNRPLGEE